MFVVGDFVTLNGGVSVGDLVRFGIPQSDALAGHNHFVLDGGYGTIILVDEGAGGPIYKVQLIDSAYSVTGSWYYLEKMLKLHNGNRFGDVRGVLRSVELSCEEKLEAIKEIYGE